jgi:hypothetical protein
MVIDMKLHVRSLAAKVFLGASLYVMATANQSSLFNAAIGIFFVIAIIVCLYFSYRLILIVNEAN